MSVRSVVTRVGAAVALLAAGLTFATTSAHASPQTVTASLAASSAVETQPNPSGPISRKNIVLWNVNTSRQESRPLRSRNLTAHCQ